MSPEELRRLLPGRSEDFYRLNSSPAFAVVVSAPRPETRGTARKPGNAARRPRRGHPASRVPRPRNGGTWTEARYWSAVRSGLRRAFRFWKPITDALLRARVAAPGPRGRKWLFLCAECRKLHLRKNVEVDHRVPCGALTRPEHLAEFLARLTEERPENFQVLCLPCHQLKTQKEKQP